MKECKTCGETDLSQFSPKPKGRLGLTAHCRACASARARARRQANPERYRQYGRDRYRANRESVTKRNRAWDRAHPDNRRDYQLRRLYGIDLKTFRSMAAAQNNRCAVCEKEFGKGKERGPHVDHDHNTGLVRSLLCGPCNRWLGWYERPDYRVAVDSYLKQHKKGVLQIA